MWLIWSSNSRAVIPTIFASCRDDSGVAISTSLTCCRGVRLGGSMLRIVLDNEDCSRSFKGSNRSSPALNTFKSFNPPDRVRGQFKSFKTSEDQSNKQACSNRSRRSIVPIVSAGTIRKAIDITQASGTLMPRESGQAYTSEFAGENESQGQKTCSLLELGRTLIQHQRACQCAGDLRQSTSPPDLAGKYNLKKNHLISK